MDILGCHCTSPSYSLSAPAMMRNTVDLPEPLRPRRPILAPGKKDREMSLMIWRLGGTILLTRSIDITYWAMVREEGSRGRPQAYRRRRTLWITGAWRVSTPFPRERQFGEWQQGSPPLPPG